MSVDSVEIPSLEEVFGALTQSAGITLSPKSKLQEEALRDPQERITGVGLSIFGPRPTPAKPDEPKIEPTQVEAPRPRRESRVPSLSIPVKLDPKTGTIIVGTDFNSITALELQTKSKPKFSPPSSSPRRSSRTLQRSIFTILRLSPEQYERLQQAKNIQILNVDKIEEVSGGGLNDSMPAKRVIYSILVSTRSDHDSPNRSMALFKQFQKKSQKLKRSTSADLMFKPLL